MLSFDETAAVLDNIADSLPEDFYRHLNGGVYLLPDERIHPKSRDSHKLYILGEYHSRRDLGRYINIYYGSFARVYGHLTPEQWKEKLRKTLLHEFTHHLEIMAGERGLEIKDEQGLERYLRNSR